MKKLLALLLAMMMVFALCACGGSGDDKAEEPAAPAEEPAAPAEPAEDPAAAPAEPAAEGDDFEAWKAYVTEYAIAGAPSEEEGKSVADAIAACTTEEEVKALPQATVFFSDIGVLEFQAWLDAGKPAADTANMGSPSGEPSGEPTEEPAAE